MSCSQFIEHDEDSSDTLVVIVNGDGTVSVDPETFQRVLKQQSPAAISIVKLEDSNEPESQTAKSNLENDENLPEEKEPFCHKVNLVIEAYYPPPANMAGKSNSDAQLAQTDFLDLLSEGLEIPVSQIQSSSNEADTLKFEDDDWVHLDHCYTSNYGGGRKQTLPVTVNTGNESEPSAAITKREVIEDPEERLRKLHELDDDSADYAGSKTVNDASKLKKKNSTVINRLKTVTEGKTTVLKKGSAPNVKSISPTDKQLHVITKAKRKSSSKNDQPETPSERVVKDDEVDGVKVFRPTKSDKKIVKPFAFNKESVAGVASSKGLTQTKLNFSKKDTNSGGTSLEVGGKLVKKDSVDKTSPDIFGPALFSTPDIIKKIKDDRENEKAGTSANYSISDETAEIEKRMSALENGEAILDRIQLQFEKQNERDQMTSVSEDERLLSDLEITDEETVTEDASKVVDDSNSELSSRKSSNNDKSESSDKEDGDYEDDPDKLWCICHKPHGNRFMICCDGCDNWYHGSCVGVTRQMGEKMEVNGTEWLCPSCRKEKSAKERDAKLKTTPRTAAAAKKSTDRHSISSSSPNALTDDASSNAIPSNSAASSSAVRRKSTPQLVTKPSSSHLCIECRKERTMLEARYCGGECIVKYVENKIAAMNSQLSEPLPDDQKIIVVDKKRDHRITGMRGPSVSNLAEWLLEHPSYEIVKPSAFPIRLPPPVESVKPAATPANAAAQPSVKPKIVTVKNKPAEVADSGENGPQATIRQFFAIKTSGEGGSIQKIRKMDEPGNNIIIREGNVLRFGPSTKKELDAKTKEKQRQIKLIPLQPLPKPDEPTKPASATTPKKLIVPIAAVEKEKKKEPVVQQTQQQVTKKEKPPPKKELQRQDSKKSTTDESDSQMTTATPSVPKGPEPIRANIRNSLTETFLARAKDLTNLSIAEAELTSLASKVEEELFNLFKDVGNKYKNKYRSLRFNINDQKNNLFRRVVEKIVTPHELVRLTPEELASAELAQWREREAKHELDMIKKAELENLNQAKVLVVKTHKGELEIESQAVPASVTDIVVPDLQPENMPGEKPKKSSSASTLSISSSNRDKEPFASSSSSSSSKEKSSKSEHNKDRDRHKKHERDRDRHKSSRSSKHRHRSSERRHSRSQRSTKSQERPDEEKKNSSGGGSGGDKEHRKSRKRSRSRSRIDREKDEKKPLIEMHEVVKNVDEEKLENVIASTTSTISATSGMLNTSAITTTEDEEKLAADLMNSYNPVDVDLSDMEPSSTVTIQTPPHAQSPDGKGYVWKGMLIMPDVAKFHTVLKEVSGNCAGLEEDLPLTIDSVGRINPDMVWNYISEQKKSGRKEIVVLRFEALDDEQRVSYLSLYSYLSQKNRMAVIGGTGPDKPLKDFYVMTLASHSPVPQVLLPLDGPGFEDYRSHLLLAIIVRNRRKKFSSSFASHMKKESYVPTSVAMPPSAKVEETESFTPPHSPTSVFVGGYSGDSKPSKNEDDEPYEPLDEDEVEEKKETVDNEDDEPYSPGALDDERTSKSLELQREMEELNRKIEEEKQKIESMSSALPLQTLPEESIELYSPSDQFPCRSETEGESSNVQLPEDLQNLLNSFSKRANDTQSPGSLAADPIVDAYKTSIDADDYADENVEEPTFSPQSDKQEDVESQPEPEIEDIAVPTSEPIEETKTSRDPRRKMMTGGDAFQTTNATQPPPPGMEEEYVLPPPATLAGLIEPSTSMVMSDSNVYNVPTSTVPPPFGYGTAPTVPHFPPPMMYMTAPPPIYQQGTPLPFTAIPPPQLYVPPPTLINHDPSMIPLPTEGSGDKSNALKRKAVDDLDNDLDKDRDRSSRRSDSRNRRGGSYYSDSKSRRSDSKSPPPRHKSGYESHHRGYQRDDADYNSGGHSRYSNNKYGRNYQSRSRSGYWKSSGDYSSGHRKYSDRSRRSSSRERDRDRDRDRDRSSRRYESSRSSKDD